MVVSRSMESFPIPGAARRQTAPVHSLPCHVMKGVRAVPCSQKGGEPWFCAGAPAGVGRAGWPDAGRERELPEGTAAGSLAAAPGGVIPAPTPCRAGSGVVPSMTWPGACANRTSVPGSKGTDDDTISASVDRSAPVTCNRSGPILPSTSTGTLVTYSLRKTWTIDADEPAGPSTVLRDSLGTVAMGVIGRFALRTRSPAASSPLALATTTQAEANGAASSRSDA